MTEELFVASVAGLVLAALAALALALMHLRESYGYTGRHQARMDSSWYSPRQQIALIHQFLIIIAAFFALITAGITRRKARRMRQYKPDLRRIAPTNGRRISAAGQVYHHLPGRLGVPYRSTTPTGRTPTPMLSWAGSTCACTAQSATERTTRMGGDR